MQIIRNGLALCTALSICTQSSAQVLGGCKFDKASLKFAGDTTQQINCLLRKVSEQGAGSKPQPIPQWLLDHADKPIDVSEAQLRHYLKAQGINVDELATSLTPGSAPGLRYFVIHDTSSPEIATASNNFPANIDLPSYSGNNLKGWATVSKKVNLIISRDGRSRLFQQWGSLRSSPATKIEENARIPGARPLFVHIENIQPRLKPPGSWGWKAPVPGLASAQERRLALAYVVASVIAGRWLIPAYHFNIDEDLPDGHDDPQHADLASWSAKVSAVAAEIAVSPK